MPRIAKELGPLDVKRLTKPGLHPVGGVAGLRLQVSPTGARSWLLRVVVGDKRREIGLGAFPGVGVALAREKAQACRDAIYSGSDPVAERAAARSSILEAQSAESATQWTFQRCAEAYIAAKSPEWKNAKHAAQWTATLKAYAYPVVGTLPVRSVGISEVMQIVEPIWLTKTETASRTRNRVELVLDWATVREYRSGDNPARWKGNLDKLLPAPSKTTRTINHRSIPAGEMHPFMVALRQRAGVAPQCLEFTILTAARSGESRGATWGEIDLKSQVWTIPAERMKAGREHRVPLSPQAFAVVLARLANDPHPAPTAFVFPGRNADRPLSDMSLTKVMRDMGADGVPHGFRATFSSWCASSTAYPSDVREMALAHAVGNATEQAYQRSDLFDKRRRLMTDWAKFTDKAPTAAANVTPIHGKAA